MRRAIGVPPWLVTGGLLVGLAFAVLVSRSAVAWWVHPRPRDPDPLAWLEREFHLSAAQQAGIRRIHERYAPLRSDMAARLARQREILVNLAADGGGAQVPFQAAAAEWDRLAARSHELTWSYVFEVAAHLPEADARRFRAEMARSVLGLVPAGAPADPGGNDR